MVKRSENWTIRSQASKFIYKYEEGSETTMDWGESLKV
jgi:hypothetical protein